MSPNRLRLILTAIFIAITVLLLWWGSTRVTHDASRQTLEQMDRDVQAAKAAAAAAAASADEAAEAARKAQNVLPGSS